MKKFFITTPIYYSNWIPHIGHSYSSLLADVIARYKRLLWYNVKFSTGVDENSQKVYQKAEEKKLKVEDYLDLMASKHKQVWDWLDISYTDFIRTTSQIHRKTVEDFLKKVYTKKDIYKWKYSWLYCIWCEAFKKETDLTQYNWKKVCPDHLTEPVKLEEENYFFKLTKYESKLKKFFKDNPDFIIPDFRYSEVKSFVNKWLEDFSISRQSNKIWIPLPFDSQNVTYVWFDALINYISVCWDNRQFWPADMHIMAKDIVRFHAIYWPAMLMSAGYSLPKKEIVTWFLTIEWQKISKTIWNVIDPVKLSKQYSRDALVLYLFYDVKVGNDIDFSWERFKNMYNSMLIWWWWNLIFRACKLAHKFNITDIEVDVQDLKQIDNKLLDWIVDWTITQKIENYIDNADLQTFVRLWYDLVQATNKYIDEKQPWKLIKQNETEWNQVLWNIVWLVIKLGVLSAGFFLDSWEKINNIFWLNTTQTDKNWEENSFYNLLIARKLKVSVKPEIVYRKNTDK